MSNYKQLIELLQEHKYDTAGFRDNFCDYLPHETELSENHFFDVIVEHQRGFKWFGIPLFSSKSLLPLLDPPTYLRLDGGKILLANDSLNNYVLPDLDWSWVWDLWYILMLADVDEQGWLYSLFWRFNSQWHGKYYFGDFVRKRLWIRLRRNLNLEH